MQYGHGRGKNECKLVADYLEKSEDSNDQNTREWKVIAQSMHSLVKHYDSMTHENVSEVFNKFYNERSIPPSLKMAEETAYNNIVKHENLDENKDSSSKFF